ncbi:hypothetical protein MtrunA17_Chr5g0395951 [Medicago truncatula]|uniref:Hydrogen peroxide induced protein, putative n=1 Tax=Medicago truncatula TaxID=3880 RepID=G7K7U6_MEDTR|nr:late embryogenesis abundant protein At5g17165 [Medicago truncatula]AES93851.1 hydrogen peroxide induced protein, putative [Medicago truncatula]AFK36608.1 unknown [Medicago truncatula]RHN53447.1 hypothetical protein MtrunA17_Chr5g0395951 [Medicago truncatula]
MAANSSSGSITTFGKRVINQIWKNNNSISSSPPLSLASRRAAYSSVYDKNADDQIHSEPVPDDVIQATQSTKYWAPNPHTGVFGPPGEHASGFHSASSTTNASAAAGSVLEEKAWFRPTSIEDLEKPHPNP